MTKPSICCVVPSIRPESMEFFRKAWAPLFCDHNVHLVTVWDGDMPELEIQDGSGSTILNADGQRTLKMVGMFNDPEVKDLLCRRTDAVRNVGFMAAASSPNKYDFILTLDDDVHPPAGSDPIQEHLDVLQRRVPISWMNTANLGSGGHYQGSARDWCEGPEQMHYLRGFPYGIRDEAPVMVSHGVWVNVPDFDGKTQLELTNNGANPERLPYSLPYFRGPVPKGCYFSFCGMNAMVRKEALPYLYFAPMGWDAGCDGLVGKDGLVHGPALNRFADIWCGILLKRHCDEMGWAIYTGASTVVHTRASDPFKNVDQERLGVEWNEWAWQSQCKDVSGDKAFVGYWRSYLDKANRFRKLILGLQGK